MNAQLPFIRGRARICDFELVRATSIAQALAALDSGAVPMAGGIDLIDKLKSGLEISGVVHLARIEALQRIVRTDTGILIGAGVRHCEIAVNPIVQAVAPGLAAICGILGNVRIRAKGTIGGNLMAGHPNYELAPTLYVLGATAHVATGKPGGTREVPMDRLGDLRPGDLLTHIGVPMQRAELMYERSMRPQLSVYMACAADAEGRLEVRAALSCVASTFIAVPPLRLDRPQDAIACSELLFSGLPLLKSDPWTSGAWRRRTAVVAGSRILQRAVHA